MHAQNHAQNRHRPTNAKGCTLPLNVSADSSRTFSRAEADGPSCDALSEVPLNNSSRNFYGRKVRRCREIEKAGKMSRWRR